MSSPTRAASCFLLLMTVCVLGVATAAPQSEEDCYRIRLITINGLDIFGDVEEPTKMHRLAQHLHVTTRESVTRQELLFKSGECVDEELLAETERNLRASRIFTDAYITPFYNLSDQTVDLQVTTLDRLTWRIDLGFSSEGGVENFESSIGESNFLGRNILVDAGFENRSDGNNILRLVYEDPRIFKLFEVEAIHSSTGEGPFRMFSIGKPLRSLDDKNALVLSWVNDETESEYHRGISEEIEIPHVLESHALTWRHELGTRKRSKRISVSTGYQSREYAMLPVRIRIPSPTEVIPLLFSYTQDFRKAFVLKQGVDGLFNREDIALHTEFTVGGGIEWRENDSGSTSHTVLLAGVNRIDTPTPRQLLAWNIDGRIRLHSGDEQASELHAFYHHYYFYSRRQSWVAGLSYEYAFTKDDLYLPLTLGEDLGLRGYDTFSFTGNKRMLLNLEHRLTYPWRTRHIAFGQAIFMDAGDAWASGTAPELNTLNWSAGWGLRLDFPALLASKILRIDFAFPLDGGDLSVSVSAGHVFRHDRVTRGFDRDY